MSSDSSRGARGAAAPLGLARMQRWFAHVMTHDGSVEDGVRSSAATGAELTEPDEASSVVRPNERMTALARLGVYHYAYKARLTECLADDYPALQHALGKAAFAGLCRTYIARTPSRSPVLDTYGSGLPALCDAADGALEAKAFCADLARLEWAIVEVVHAPAPEPLALAALAALEPASFAKVALVGSPALRFLALQHTVAAYYRAYREGKAPVLASPASDAGAAARAETDALVAARPTFLIVQRRGALVHREELAADEARVLQALLSGTPVGEAMGAAAAGGVDPNQVSSWFATWIGRGYFTGIAAT